MRKLKSGKPSGGSRFRDSDRRRDFKSVTGLPYKPPARPGCAMRVKDGSIPGIGPNLNCAL